MTRFIYFTNSIIAIIALAEREVIYRSPFAAIQEGTFRSSIKDVEIRRGGEVRRARPPARRAGSGAVEGDDDVGAGGGAGPVGDEAGGEEQLACFLQGVVVALGLAAVVVGAGLLA